MRPHNHFNYKGKELCCEGVCISEVAQKVGTPFYLYSYNSLIENYRKLAHAFSKLSPLICYSLKANGNLTLSRILTQEGAGADILSEGELHKALQAGFPPQKIVFAGPGKKEKEIECALKENIFMLNVESASELELIEKTAQRLNHTARVSLRLNPDVDVKTHRYITTGKKENKFGLVFDEAEKLYEKIKKSSLLKPVGIHMHIGSQITSFKPYLRALEKAGELFDLLKEKGLDLQYIDMGGGFGISYKKGKPPLDIEELAEKIYPLIKKRGAKLIIEPGRFLVGPAGLLITQVLYKKRRREKTFIIVDAGMNDLIRPSLYDAYHQIKKLKEPDEAEPDETVDVVGPVCESGDFFALGRSLPKIWEGEYLALMDAGAYSFSMSFSYNARPRPAEVLVKEDRWWIIRKRETYQDLIKGEVIPDELFSSSKDSSAKNFSTISPSKREPAIFPSQKEPIFDLIPFTKMQGSGNDFIVVDNRGKIIKDRENFSKRVCSRKKGIGADGLLLLEESDKANFKMRIFNPDGTEAEMCGNAARCIARFVYLKGIAGEKCSFETLSGPISSYVNETQVKIRMKDPSRLHLNLKLILEDGSYEGHYLDTGVPHFILFVPEVEKAPLEELSLKIRYHRHFQPQGTNVNFVEVGRDSLKVRTYERGVEGETLSCGTGVVAAAIIANIVRGLGSPLKVKTKGGGLKVYFQRRDKTNLAPIENPSLPEFTEVFLEGEAQLVYEGRYERKGE